MRAPNFTESQLGTKKLRCQAAKKKHSPRPDDNEGEKNPPHDFNLLLQKRIGKKGSKARIENRQFDL